ncbi:MAG: hypothetical protein L6R40_006137 [Gallowayella cf. fulva]|nr:MAG: hypothetical protein L6R40_006137 [Xanthomendoza cf. fulva]
MRHPAPGLNLDIEALSGICGSISIACWIVVFSPQIIENFRRHSADGLSLIFIIIWLLGDIFNILGAVLQGVLPTMTILAVYYTLADIVLLGQCFYYRGFTLSDAQTTPHEEAIVEESTEESPLLASESTNNRPISRPTAADADWTRRSSSFSSFHSHLNQVDARHLSPATPLIASSKTTTHSPIAFPTALNSTVRSLLLNTTALILVCAAGVLGWFLTTRSSQRQHHHHHHHHASPISANESEEIPLDLWGQIFGYLCAALYLGSRVPQLLLNYRRKSTEGVSMLFFLFACVGNLTYVMSIFAYEPECRKLEREFRAIQCEDGEWSSEYRRYILVNTSWLIGSAGTLLLDLLIFTQFWIYRKKVE